MALTNMHSDLRFNPFSGLCINLVILILYYIILYYAGPLSCILGCNKPINQHFCEVSLILYIYSCSRIARNVAK